jgi:GT2 family glycosyltransferase
MRKLTVVIVNYNVKYYVEQCLMSLQRALADVDAEVYVVDNHSQDGSVEYLSERFPSVNIIRSQHNLGFARANNLAIRQSESEYVLLINPDTFVGEQVVTQAIRFMDDHEKAGGLAAWMLKTDGSSANESRRGLPTPLVSFYKIFGFCSRFPKSKVFGKYYMGYLPWDKPAQIEVVSGAFFFARRKVLDEVGLLDEDFFMYGEDIDLSYRILKGGYENWYLPIKILHYKGESTQKSSFRYVHVFYDAMLIFFRKHYSHLSLLISIPVKTAVYLKAFWELIKMQVRGMKKSLGFIQNRGCVPSYLFIGQQEALDECRGIARSNGLDAEFVVGDESSLPEGHLKIDLPEKEELFVVYDTDSYAFETILDLFSRRPDGRVLMGTYSRRSKRIITEDEVIK